MALKERKLPKPSEIKSMPQSFSQEEIDKLKTLRTEINNLAFQFGDLYIQKVKIEELEKELKEKLKSLEEEESKIAKSLSDKYGDGSIDLESGTFTPSK
tara:strand:- start:506 stop:802 length:297 start_codon:yes stop_codon:yes gene_type:complete